MTDYTLDIKRHGSQFTVEGLHVGDCGLRVFNFHFCEGQNAFRIPDGCIATLYAQLPDGNNTIVYTTCKTIDNTVVYSLSGAPKGHASLTSFPGRVDCEIRLTTLEGGVLTSPKFSLMVEETLQDDGAIEAVSDYSALTDALERVLEAEYGLSSKIDRINGTENNITAFGPDGTLSDSGIGISEINRGFIILYDTTGKSNNKNKETLAAYQEEIAKGKTPFLMVKQDNTFYPALYVADETRPSVYGVLATEALSISFTDTVYYSVISYVSTTGEFSPSSIKPASQALTAKWVQQLINDTIVEGAW